MTHSIHMSLTAEQLMAKSRRVTGVDIIDEEIIEALTALHKSYNEDACMNAKQADFVENFLLQLLNNRLRMKRDYLNHPEIAGQQIESPIIICGMARTGSTKLQKLLAASDDFNWLPFWQSYNPSLYSGNREESTDARIQRTDDLVAWIEASAPGLKSAHEYATHEPEEESFVMMHSFMSLTFGTTQLTGFLQWIADKDIMKFQLEYLRDTLKYLQWQGLASESKRWILKAPHYFGHEITIKNVFPDSCLVMTHRHPKDTMPSVCSFLTHFNKPASSGVLDPAVFVGGNIFQIQQHLRNRQSRADINWLDILYSEVTQSVETVARKVYEFSGQPLTDQSLQRMLNWDASNPIHAKGSHKYTLEDFGLNEQNINQDFADYIELIDQLFGKK